MSVTAVATGPVGEVRPLRALAAPAMLIGLPLLAYYLHVSLASHEGGLTLPAVGDIPGAMRPTVVGLVLYGAWLLFQAVLYIAGPGRDVPGLPQEGGARLRYRMNGWFAFWTTGAVLTTMAWRGWIPATIAYDEFAGLLTAANLHAFALATIVHLRARRRPDPGAVTRHPLHDYVMGLWLNPRWGRFDVKFFCESRPGLLLWAAINASLAAKQYELHGTVTTPMLLVNAFQLLYVADYFFHEDAILSTWDIRHERFGWMLCWGSLVWVPFTYTIQAYYLVTHPHDLPLAATLAIVALNVTGYAIFRSANSQKHRFRSDPGRTIQGRRVAFIRTGGGTLLLTSGWWGRARHANYLGDLLMALAWCLPAGLAHPLPYFYVAYFAILLIHRARRDDARCAKKYGRAWEAYCQQVPWRIIPRVY